MEDSCRYYVYEHWRTDKDECFYVGKGHGRRAYQKNRRNPHCEAIANLLRMNNLSVEVRIIQDNLSEADAFSLEMRRIAEWRAAGVEITNIGAGGDGNSGRIAWNRKPVVCLETRQVFDSATAAGVAVGLSLIAVSDVCREKYRSANGFHFVYSAIVPSEAECVRIIRDIEFRLAERRRRVDVIKRNYRGVIDGRDAKGRSAAGPVKNSRPVVCLDDGTEYPSASAAARAYKVDPSALTELCLGKRGRKSVRGLRFKYMDAA